MTPFKQLVSRPGYSLLCIATLWIGFIAGVLLFHLVTSQMTKLHRLAFFSQYELGLIHNLQLERAVSAGFVASGQSEEFTGRLRYQYGQTDKIHRSFVKAWGRFNSSNFGPALTGSLEAAGARLSHLDEIRSGVSAKKLDTFPTIEAYTRTIEHLIAAISQLETVQLEDPAAGRSREAFLGFLMQSELAAGELASGHPIEAATAKRLNTLAREHIRLHGLANIEFQKLIEKTGTEAARRANLFLVSLLGVVIATLSAIAWHWPPALRQSLLIALIVFNIALALWTMSTGPYWMAKESGPIEGLQAVALATAFALFCRDATRHPGASRPAAVSLACLCFVIFFREIDLRIFDAPELLINITTGPVRKGLSAILVVLTAIYVATRNKNVPGLIRSSLTWRAWPFYIWPFLLITAEKIELWVHARALPGSWTNGQFWEELVELNAYLALLYAAYIFAEIYRSRTDSESGP